MATLRDFFFSQPPPEEVRETFEQTYPVSPDGRLSLNNYTGTVQITTWDRQEVKVSAVKRAYGSDRLAEVKINVVSQPSHLSIESKYAQPNLRWSDDERERLDNSARVDYVLTVPRGVRLDEIELHNGTISLDGVTGNVAVSTLNGRVKMSSLTGNVKVSTLNGRIEAAFGIMGEGQQISLSSINGQILVTLISDNALVNAHTVHGKVRNEFGRSRAGWLAGGRARVKITSVNSDIAVRHASPELR